MPISETAACQSTYALDVLGRSVLLDLSNHVIPGISIEAKL